MSEMKCLIIKKPWIDLILSGRKIWEMRSRPTKIRGKIGLIEQGTGLIVGEADLSNCFHLSEIHDFDPPLPMHQINFHLISDKRMTAKWPYAWVLNDAKRYDMPIEYKHPQGAVIWVNVDLEK